jgi:ABC-type branched-subunit amino acid transport system substrate-binding protein
VGTLFKILAGAAWMGLVLADAASWAQVKTAPRRLRVAAVLALTGPAAVHGRSMRQGLELAKADLEREGWQVELTLQDDGTVPARSVTAIQALAAQGHTLFIGPAWSFQVEAAGPVYAKNNLCAFAPAVFSGVAGGRHEHLFYGVTPAAAKTAPLAAWLKKNKIRRAAIFVAQSAWGDIHEQVFHQAVREAGAEVVYSDRYEYGSEPAAIPVILAKIKASNPDAVLHTSSAEGVALTVKKMAELRLDIPLLSTDDMNDAFSLGLISATPKLYALTLPVSEPFRKHYLEHFGEAPGIYADSAYDGMMIFARAVEMTDGSPQQIRRFIQQDLNYTGASGVFQYDANGDVQKTPYVIVRAGNPER